LVCATVARSAIDWSAAQPLVAKQRHEVDAGRGWQHAGASLMNGRRYEVHATGRCTLGKIGDTAIETEADGISLDWYRGRPLGRLLAAQWVESPADGGRPRFVVLGEGASAMIQAATNGPLYLKLNEPPGDMADDAGSIAVEITPAP
jgi:hypothetical protein